MAEASSCRLQNQERPGVLHEKHWDLCAADTTIVDCDVAAQPAL